MGPRLRGDDDVSRTPPSQPASFPRRREPGTRATRVRTKVNRGTAAFVSEPPVGSSKTNRFDAMRLAQPN